MSGEFANRKKVEGSWAERVVWVVETVGNRLPHPFTLFVILAVLTLLLSYLLSELGVSATYVAASSGGGAEPVMTTVTVKNLLSLDSLKMFLTDFEEIYVKFPPLGLAMAMILGVGVMEASGFISALMRKTVLGAPPYMITAILAFVGINANLASEAGVILTPTLGGALFKAVGRNPWIGIAAGYAAASGGFTANLLIAGTDVLLSGITASAAGAMSVQAPVHPMINWYFMIAATLVVTVVVTVVTERFMTRYLKNEAGPGDAAGLVAHEVTADENRGLRWAGVAAAVYVAVVLAAAIPEAGPLRNEEGRLLPKSPLTEGIVAILFLFFCLVGIAYGYGARKITSGSQIPKLMESGLRGLVGFLVVALPAAFFIHFFSESRLAAVLAVKGAGLLSELDMGGIGLLVLFVLATTVLNLFLPSGSAKWLIMAPIFVPIFAAVGLSPAVTQLSFRVGDSATNIISPIKSYLPVIIGLMEQYRPDRKEPVGIGTVISLELPYSVALLVSLTLLLVIWYLFGLPLGPGASIWL